MTSEVIVTDKLNKIYGIGDIQVHALKDVSISISKGEYIAIMGPSGSGKSTFMNLIGCLDIAAFADSSGADRVYFSEI
jgi:putative ABC transport system ATP-binding protein